MFIARVPYCTCYNACIALYKWSTELFVLFTGVLAPGSNGGYPRAGGNVCVCVCLCVCVVLHQVPHGTTRAWSPHRATCCVINHQPEPEEALSHSPQRGEAECLKGYRAEGMGCIVGVGLSTWSQGDPATGGSPLYHWRTCKCPD